MEQLKTDLVDLMVIAHDALASLSAQGWEVVSILEETEVHTIVDEHPCPGGVNGHTCTHGAYNSPCSLMLEVHRGIPTKKTMFLVGRSDDDRMAGIRSSLEAAQESERVVVAELAEASKRISEQDELLRQRSISIDNLEKMRIEKDKMLDEAQEKFASATALLASKTTTERVARKVLANMQEANALGLDSAIEHQLPMTALQFYMFLGTQTAIINNPHNAADFFEASIDKGVLNKATREDGIFYTVKDYGGLLALLAVHDAVDRLADVD